MTTYLDREPVIRALSEEFRALDELLETMDPDDFSVPTPLPGWDVRAVVAHLIGTESMLMGRQPAVTDVDTSQMAHVHNDIGAFNEQWIASLADVSPDDLRREFRSITDERLAALADMDDESWNKEGFTPAGPDTYGRFMRVRIFDCWLHEQDIRDALGRPGHETGEVVALTLDEMSGAMGFVVGKKAGAPDGATVSFELTGRSGRSIHVAVTGRAAVVDSLEAPATVTMRMPVGVFVRLAGGRQDAVALQHQVEIEGDEALGRRVLEQLNYTI